MPVRTVRIEGKVGYQFGTHGHVYFFNPKNAASKKRAYNKAVKQGKAIKTHDCFYDAKFDPTGTGKIRNEFVMEFKRRFAILKKLINQSLVENNAFGVYVNDAMSIPYQQLNFTKSSDKVKGFMEWLKRAENDLLFSVSTVGSRVASSDEEVWSNIYIERGYRKGASDADKRLEKAGIRRAGTLQQLFERPIHADRVGLLYTRNYNDLVGITEAMDNAISKVLAEGIVSGDGPLKIAREINKKIDSIGLTRATALARTEIIRAHAEASLNLYEEANLSGVEAMSEWSTAGDDKVCPICEAMEGQTFKLEDARGLIPAHVNCFTADTFVLPHGDIKSMSQRNYDGPLLIFKTESGRMLKVTPNHPIMTSLGSLPAKEISVDAELIIKPNVIGQKISELFDGFMRLKRVSIIELEIEEDFFHGDGQKNTCGVMLVDNSFAYLNDPKMYLEHMDYFSGEKHMYYNKLPDDLLDKVISVDQIMYSGQVFNMETEHGFYTANCVVTSNCRCVWIPHIESDVEFV